MTDELPGNPGELTSDQLDDLGRFFHGVRSDIRVEIALPGRSGLTTIRASAFDALIAMAKRTEAAERKLRDALDEMAVHIDRAHDLEVEREVLRAELTQAVAWAEDGPDGCFSCVPDDAPGQRHEDWCWAHSAKAALTESGGDAE